MVNRCARGKLIACAVLLGFVGHDGDAFDSFVIGLVGNLVNVQLPVDRLPASHGDGVIEQQLVGDVDAGAHGRPDCQRSRMEVRAVPEVLKNMPGFDKGLLTDPGHSFTTHLAKGIGLSVHPGDHIVAAYAALSTTALGDFGGRIVRASRAKIGDALHGQWIQCTAASCRHLE